jgi:hypothetical protein
MLQDYHTRPAIEVFNLPDAAPDPAKVDQKKIQLVRIYKAKQSRLATKVYEKFGT